VDGYGIDSYGDGFAEVYDRWYGEDGDVDACADVLADLAGGGRVLELGVGTGRVALPLSHRVRSLTGIDSSLEMLARLRSKDGASQLHLIEGDMALVPVGEDRFDLAYFSYNTFFNLADVGRQQGCLDRLGKVLAPRGRLVIEGFVPDPEPDARQGVVVPTRMTVDSVVLTATIRDPADQTIMGQHIEFGKHGVALHPWHIRYTRPEQLDELAESAGFDLEDRWAGWRRQPFDSSSSNHVSVYTRTGTPSGSR
jgi:ubiquinone/menaquinone biosynthesis C-methylase UbiE